MFVAFLNICQSNTLRFLKVHAEDVVTLLASYVPRFSASESLDQYHCRFYSHNLPKVPPAWARLYLHFYLANIRWSP